MNNLEREEESMIIPKNILLLGDSVLDLKKMSLELENRPEKHICRT